MYAAFIQGGVSIVGSTRDSSNIPRAARMIGCRVSPDRTRVSGFASKSANSVLIDLRRAGLPIAVVVPQPSSHRSIQLKAKRAEIRSVEDRDFDLLTRYVDAFVTEVMPFGFSEAFIRALLACDRSDVVVVE